MAPAIQCPPAWAGDGIPVQAGRDPLGAGARGERLEDAADDRRLRGVDLAQTPLCVALRGQRAADDAVAVAEPATGAAGAHPTLKAAPGLVGEVLQVEGAHGPLEADVQLGNLALGERHDPAAREARHLEEAGDVLLVAAEAVEALGQDHADPPRPQPPAQRREAGAL